MRLNSIGAVTTATTSFGQDKSSRKRPLDSVVLFGSNPKQEPQHGNEPVKRFKRPEEPQEPQETDRELPDIVGVKTITVPKDCHSLHTLASKYHVFDDEVVRYNPELKENDYQLTPGQKIKMPYRDSKAMEKFNEEGRQYREAFKKYCAEKKQYDKVLFAIERLEQLYESRDGKFNKIELNVDYNTGQIKIKTTSKVSLGSIKRDLNIKDGKLLAQNPQIKENYTPSTFCDLGFENKYLFRRINDWDETKINAGEELVIDPGDLIPVEKRQPFYSK